MTPPVAVSNIAWSKENDAAVARVLTEEGLTGVELAPTVWRENPYDAPRQDVAALRREWDDRGLSVVSLQALLFGHPELHLFGGDASRGQLDSLLRKAIDFAHTLGARTLVFGSPKNRHRGAMPMPDAMRIACDFFTGIADYAHPAGTMICLEANPSAYGCDFLVSTSEAVDLCRSIDHPAVRVNGDVGGMILAEEDVALAIEGAAPWLGHFHASEPHLAELASEAVHKRAGTSLLRSAYTGCVSIEMRRSAAGDEIDAIRRSVRLAKRAYQVSS